MADETQSPAEPKATTTDTILTRVQNGIDAAQAEGPLVDRVVDVFVEREVGRRADLLVKGFDKLVTLTKAHDDINKPDGAKAFSAPNTTPLPQTYSEKRLSEISKARKAVEKLTTAVNTALTKADFAGLEKALKGGGDGDNGKGGDDN